jgi:hypothetical protein
MEIVKIAVDYIMFNFDNFSISNFAWTGFIKENSHVWSKKVKSRNKFICLLLKTKVCKTITYFLGKKANFL